MNSSVVLITNKKNKSFGTGFVIYKDKNYSYILTCFHVVESIIDSLLINYTHEAKVIVDGSSQGIDLAILKIKVGDEVPFDLLKASSCKDFKVIGYKPFIKEKDTHVCEPIDCSFDENIHILARNGKTEGFKINIARDDSISFGYSGSPLICKKNSKVIAVVSNKQGSKDAYAISIKHIKDIWKDIPLELQWEEDHRLVLTSNSSKFKIFVSYIYSNIEEERWLLKLLESLREILTWRLKKDNDFFKISYQKDLNIEEEINSSTIHLVLLSNKYVNSKKHLDELESISLKSKNMMIFEYDDFIMPSIIKKKKTFIFWNRDKEKKLYTYNSKSKEIENHSTRYFELVEDIATTIQRSINNNERKKSAKVFLAKSTDDLEFNRSAIERYLEGLNFDVYPKKIYPQDKGYEFKEAVENDMKECELFIQLLSEHTKEAPFDLREGYFKAQFDIAVSLNIPILQWSEKINLDEVRDRYQKELLSTEYIRIVPIEEFKRMIDSHFEEKKVRLAKEKKYDKSFIFVNFYHQERYDTEIANKIFNTIEEDINLIPTNMKPSELSAYIDDCLEECDYYMLIYGHASLYWVNNQYMRFRKINGKRKKEISALIIYDVAEKKEEKIPFKASYLEIIDGREVESIDKIQRFISNGRNL